MKPKLHWAVYLIISLHVRSGYAQLQQIEGRHDDVDFFTTARTFLFGKLVLVPVLAAIGLKFLALLPIVLTKIALLSGMNFLSTNLNLIVSTLFGLKNFMGKYGLWKQENTTHHPDIETFAEWANQPVLQPSLRYQYVLQDKKSTKAPLMTNVLNGFVPMDSNYKFATTVDRRTRANEKTFIPKSTKSKSGGGKYKCYWTNEDEDTVSLFGMDSQVRHEEPLTRRKFNLNYVSPYQANYDSYLQRNIYGVTNENLNRPALENYVSKSNFPDYQSFVNIGSNRQVATRRTTEKINDNTGIRDVLPPFTADRSNQVKVDDENHRSEMKASTQLVYLMQEGIVTESTDKFKDNELVQ